MNTSLRRPACSQHIPEATSMRFSGPPSTPGKGSAALSRQATQAVQSCSVCRLLTFQEANSQLAADRPAVRPPARPFTPPCPVRLPIPHSSLPVLPSIHPSFHSSSQHPTARPSTFLPIHPFTPISIHYPLSQPASQLPSKHLFRANEAPGPCAAAGKQKEQDGVDVRSGRHDPPRS